MNSTESLGRLVLRLTVGGLLLLHGVHKLVDGIDPIKQMVAAHGLPAALAYGVYFGEVLAPILIILGVVSRIGALMIVINMAVAVYLAGMGSLYAFNPTTGGYALELEAFYLFGGVAVLLLGAGSYSFGSNSRRWN